MTGLMPHARRGYTYIPIEFVSSAMGGLPTSGAQPVQVTLPSGSVGDLFVMMGSLDAAMPSGMVTDAGWTELFTNTINCGSSVWYKYMTGSVDTTANLTRDTNKPLRWQCNVYRYVDATTPINTWATNTSGGGDPNCPSITPTVDNCLILAIGHGRNDSQSIGGVTVPTGYSNLIGGYTGSSGKQGVLYTAEKTLAVAAAEDPSGWVWNTYSDQNAATTIALQPA